MHGSQKAYMKKAYIFLIAALVVCACQKSPVDRISGSYSFKNGGTLEVLGKIPSDIGTLPGRDTVVNSSLVPESGQMRILPKGSDEIVVTMNITGGNPVIFNGKLTDDKIILSPVERKVTMFNELNAIDLPIDVSVKVQGVGTIYGNTLVFSMEYNGNFTSGDIPCRILSSNVNCIATRNE